MDEEAKARVRRLTKYISKFRKDLCEDDGRPSPDKMEQASGRLRTYWSDVLRMAKPSFAAAAARKAEASFKMPHLYLEGAGWPFEEIDEARYTRLTPIQQGRVQQEIINILNVIESENKTGTSD